MGPIISAPVSDIKALLDIAAIARHPQKLLDDLRQAIDHHENLGKLVMR